MKTGRRRAEPLLVLISGPHGGRTIPLEADMVTVGRDASNALTLGDPALSRHHDTARAPAARFHEAVAEGKARAALKR